jgi:hypothetical protein
MAFVLAVVAVTAVPVSMLAKGCFDCDSFDVPEQTLNDLAGKCGEGALTGHITETCCESLKHYATPEVKKCLMVYVKKKAPMLEMLVPEVATKCKIEIPNSC